ncbi:MAG: KH domain-containing protein [Candidatus Gracilibacteria bacterium]
MHDDQKFLEFAIHALVDDHDQVKIERVIDDYGVFFKVCVSKEDMGKIIGKKGRTAQALKTLLRVVGSRTQSRVNMKIIDPERDEVVA